MKSGYAAAAALLAVCAGGGIARAQDASVPTPAEGESVVEDTADEMPAPSQAPDPATLKMPALAFQSTPEIEADFDKYFYFHRENTSFTEAYADVRECDALASGIRFYGGADAGAMASAMAQYGVLAGGIGGAIGSAMADAIFGSAMRRQMHRVNVRNCMSFKGYQRYGLSRDLWTEFNFEEGMGRKKEGVRNQALALQALVASGPKPATKELGL